MKRRERAELRRAAFAYARRYLGRERLPAGVPALINDYVNRLTSIPETGRELDYLLHPYRKPYYGL